LANDTCSPRLRGVVLLAVLCAWDSASAQKRGGILRMYSIDSPANMSILEEATVFAQAPMADVFNNLVMFDQHVKQNSLQSILPDLASSWTSNEDGTELGAFFPSASCGLIQVGMAQQV